MQTKCVRKSRQHFNLKFLAEASQILNRSLDPETTVAEIARLYVPLISEMCVIDLFEEGRWRRAAVAHVDEEARAHLWACGKSTWDLQDLACLDQYIQTDKSLHILSFKPDAETHQTHDAEKLKFVKELIGFPKSHARASLTMPISARGRVFGLMTIASTQSDSAFSSDEAAFFEDLARRAATALDNARLYQDAERSRALAEAARKQTQFLSDTSETMARAIYPQQIADSATQLAIQKIADACLIHISPPEGASVWSIADVCLQRSCALQKRIQRDPTCLRLHEHLENHAIATSLLQEKSAQEIDFLEQFHGYTHLTRPLIVHGDSRGFITFLKKQQNGVLDFSPDQRALIESFLLRVRGAIDRACLFTELQDAIAIRDDFLSIASHELRTPLTALELQFDNLRRMLNKIDTAHGMVKLRLKLERANRQTDRLRKLIDNLLDVSRISSRRFLLEYEDFDICHLAEDIIERWTDEAMSSGCDIRLVAPSDCTGRWDPLRLEQVMTNLLANAIKYGSGAPIEVRIEQNAPHTTFSFTDQGIGVDPQALEKIFDRFERAVSSREFGGLGLGLFITREIVHAHGGTIKVDSRLGLGSTFIVTLPTYPHCDASQALPVSQRAC